MEKTLDKRPPSVSTVVKENPAVKSALNMVARCLAEKTKNDAKIDNIKQLFNEGVQVWTPDGELELSSKLLFQVRDEVMKKVKLLDFAIHGQGRPEWMEKVVTAAVGTILDTGGFVKGMLGKQGAAEKSFMYGDGYLMLSGNKGKGAPFKFIPLENSQIYLDPDAVVFRDADGGRGVSKLVVIRSFSWAEFEKMYPKKCKKVAWGEIPRKKSVWNSTDKTVLQTADMDAEEDYRVEVAYSFDLYNEAYTVFAGRNCFPLEDFRGKKYPFKKEDGQLYIPIIHKYCRAALEGLYNLGLGDYMFELAVLSRELKRKQFRHTSDQASPYDLLYLPTNKKNTFYNSLALADELKAAGKRAMVTVDYDPKTEQPGMIQTQTLQTTSLTNDWIQMKEMLDQEYNRIGIFLDGVSGVTKTAKQIAYEEDRQNDFVSHTMEQFAPEQKEAIEMVLQFIRDFVPKSDKTPLNLTTKIVVDGEEIPTDTITLGMVADELKRHHYFVKVNSSTGVVPSNTMKQIQTARAMQTAIPGSRLDAKLRAKFVGFNDIEATAEDFLPQGGEPQAGGLPQDVLEGDELPINAQ